MSNFMQIRPMGAELFYAGGQAHSSDIAKLVVAFRNFAKAPKDGRDGGMACRD
jgi:hypothetical protein